MSRLQELHPDQQAVLQLVLRRRMAYGDLAGLLDLTPEGVRERALDAVDGLAPDDVPGLALEDRDRIADHLLGQSTGAERDATAALLAEHPPARAWAAVVAAELEPLGGPATPLPSGVPDAGVAPVPDAADSGDAPAEALAGPSSSGTRSSAPPRPVAGGRGRKGPFAGGLHNPFAGRSPRLLAGTAAAVLVAVLLVLWIALGGDDSDDGERAATPSTTTTAAGTAEDQALAAQFVAALPPTVPFRPPPGASGVFARVRGTARPTVSQQSPGVPVLALTIQGLPELTNTRRYFVWADKNGASPVFLGQLADRRGAEIRFQGLDLKSREPVVVDPTVYSRVRITREGNSAPTKPGPTVIVGTITPRS